MTRGALPRLLVITDRRQAGQPLEAVVEACLDAGAPWILFRDKDLDGAARRALGERLARLVRRAGALLSISRDVALAAALGADGVHVSDPTAVTQARAALGPDAVIGLSAHDAAEVEAGARAGADYATLSPIFPSPSKPGYGPPLGASALRAAGAAGLRLHALGGVTPGNAAECLAAGAAGLAVMGEIMRSRTPGARIRDFLDAVASGARAEP